MPVDHARLTELFTEALELDTAGQRALIERACAENAELGRELAEMLDADEHIVTALRTAGFAPNDLGELGGALGRKPTASPSQVAIPGYQLAATLGEGGMGTVYAGHDAQTQEPVAIKVLQVASEEALARFRAEAAIMEKLQHPGIARVLAAGDAASRPYIVMEHIDGVTLDAYIAQHAPPLSARLVLFAAICDAVEYAHRCGVIHRDLKPANIMVRSGTDVTILDFGVARAAESRGRTRLGDMLGTPLYMSPEQATGRNAEVGPASDVYALGVILYELVTGRHPYELRGKGIVESVQTITTAVPAPLADPALDAIVQRALAKSAAQRMASAGELAAAIRGLSA